MHFLGITKIPDVFWLEILFKSHSNHSHPEIKSEKSDALSLQGYGKIVQVQKNLNFHRNFARKQLYISYEMNF